jgi:hypothetical protein
LRVSAISDASFSLQKSFIPVLLSIFLFLIIADEVVTEGQVQPFWLDTSDGEKLFCWHVLPLDVYLENEHELTLAATTGEVSDGLEGTVGAKLLKRDSESRVVVNFHGVSPSTAFVSLCLKALSICVVSYFPVALFSGLNFLRRDLSIWSLLPYISSLVKSQDVPSDSLHTV